MFSKERKENFDKFYWALPLSVPKISKDPALKKFYSRVYKGNTHNLSSAEKIAIGIIHRPLWLYKVIKETRLNLSTYGNEVKQEFGISKRKQLKEILSLSLKRKAAPEYYYTKKLYKYPDIKFGENFITNMHAGAIHSRLLAPIESKVNINNKLKFYKHCQPDISKLLSNIAIINNGEIMITVGTKKIPDEDLFIKPINGNHGRMCFSIKHKEGHFFIKRVGQALTKKQMLGYITNLSKKEPYLLQRRVSNRADLNDLSNGSLLSTRIITYIDKDNTVKVLFSFIQIPFDNMETSNDGLYARIFHESGKLDQAYNIEGYEEIHHTHPNTGGQITGRSIPNYEMAKKQCFDLHATKFSDIPCIGWDVCYPEGEPKIIEGNLNWSIEIIKSLVKDYDYKHYLDIMNYHIDQMDSK